MNVVRQLGCSDFRSKFFTGSIIPDTKKNTIKPGFSSIPVTARCFKICEGPLLASHLGRIPIPENSKHNQTKLLSVATEAAATEISDIESLFSENSSNETRLKKGGKRNASGASGVSSGIRLEHITKTFKGFTVLKDVSWEVKKGERVGLVGVNGAGKTTQLKIIVGDEEPDSGQVIKAKPNMKIAFLTQEFEVVPSRTVREEFMNAFNEQLEVAERIEKVQKALESSVDDMDLMGRLLDELDLLQKRADAVELYDVDVKINKMMPELGFSQEDGDRLVASFSGGWQMRMSLGKILLQDSGPETPLELRLPWLLFSLKMAAMERTEITGKWKFTTVIWKEPDLLLLDEPTNHLDLDTIEWLEGYLKKQDVPMVVVSHDRAFLDQLCTKIVETDMGVSKTYEGNYSEYVLAKAAWIETQRMAWEKQQKEIDHTKDMISRLSAGARAGRASSAEKGFIHSSTQIACGSNSDFQIV
eukprot:Gb_01082 [translate_table: standard]